MVASTEFLRTDTAARHEGAMLFVTDEYRYYRHDGVRWQPITVRVRVFAEMTSEGESEPARYELGDAQFASPTTPDQAMAGMGTLLRGIADYLESP